MRIIAGSILVLSGAILGSSGVIRSADQGSRGSDLVSISIGWAFFVGVVGMLIVAYELFGKTSEK
jgi:hypothetical protein